MISETTNQRSSFAITRVDRLIGRIFTLASMLTLFETIMNAWGQNGYLHDGWMGLALGLIVAAHAYNLINFWFLGGRRLGYLMHGLAYVLAFASWPLQVLPTAEMPDGYRPWLWWATGSASVAVGMFVPKIWAYAYMVIVPTSWTLLHLTEIGGSANPAQAIADGFYSTLFPATLVGLVWLLREGAKRVDIAVDASRESETERITLDAQSRERARLDTLLYTGVFGALKAAASAKDKAEQLEAVEAAEEGLASIKGSAEQVKDTITLFSFFDSLDKLARRIDPDCSISISGASDLNLGGDVAAAITNATIEALTNSMQHAGGKAKRLLRLKGTKRGLKVVIKDDGVGFRPSRVPQHSLGLRLVLFRSVNMVGGQVHIDSKPGAGATVVIEWEAAE